MRKDRNSKKALYGKGLAAAAVIGVAAIAIASITAYNRTMNALTPITNSSSENTWSFTTGTADNVPVNGDISDAPKEDAFETLEEPNEPTANSVVGVPKDENSDSGYEAIPADITQTEEAEEVNKPVASTAGNIMPVKGEVSHPFSNGELVKSETLGVWKTHDGCDILCPLGTDVLSMSDGVVKEIREDPLWGVYVIIEQSNGLEVHYCGLAKELNVKVGQELKSGEIIGKTSDTCQAEIVQEPHLHLGVKQGGKWIDPMSVIDSNS